MIKKKIRDCSNLWGLKEKVAKFENRKKHYIWHICLYLFICLENCICLVNNNLKKESFER